MLKACSRKICALLILPALLLPFYPITAKSSPNLAAYYPMFQKGMCYVTWSKEGFRSAASDASLRYMAEAGIDCVSIIPTWYQEGYNSTEILPEEERTPSDSSIRHVIRKAHEYGMRVMLKPHIDLIRGEGNSRSDIGFNSDDKWREWFFSYSKFINHYAALAEDEGAEFFCVGTELTFASTRKDMWEDLVIPDVRKIFRGQITYAANWDEYKSVPFWGKLDYAGIDAYFPLCGKDNPGAGELSEGWAQWINEIEEFQRGINKPVVFTEAGYMSADSAARKPWEDAALGKPNTELQANCYRSLLEAFWDKPWFFGVYWWNWNTYERSGGPNDKRFTPQNKPALQYVRSWYAKPVARKEYLYAEVLRLPIDREIEERMRLEEAILARNAAIACKPYTVTPRMAAPKPNLNSIRNSE